MAFCTLLREAFAPSEFTEVQIVFALRQADTGVTVAKVYRKRSISEATYYNWKKYGGRSVLELRRLKQLEEAIYCLEGLNSRSKRPRRKRAAAHRLALSRLHQSWSKDFVAANLLDGRKIRALPIVDNFSHQRLAIYVGQSLKGEDVVAVMQRLDQQLGVVPERTQVANGGEFIRKLLDYQPYDPHVSLDFSDSATRQARRILNRLTAASATSA